MRSVTLLLPPEVIDDLDLPYEGVRDVSAVTLAIQGISVAANIATLATLQPQLGVLVAAIRNWRLRDPRRAVTLTAKGPGLDLTIELPSNVSKAQLMRQLQPLFDEDEGSGTPR